MLGNALGDPGGLIERAHAEGVLTMSMVTTVEEAVLVAESGADVVVAQGAEAGGHRSTFELGPNGEVPLFALAGYVDLEIPGHVPVTSCHALAENVRFVPPSLRSLMSKLSAR